MENRWRRSGGVPKVKGGRNLVGGWLDGVIFCGGGYILLNKLRPRSLHQRVYPLKKDGSKRRSFPFGMAKFSGVSC